MQPANFSLSPSGFTRNPAFSNLQQCHARIGRLLHDRRAMQNSLEEIEEAYAFNETCLRKLRYQNSSTHPKEQKIRFNKTPSFHRYRPENPANKSLQALFFYATNWHECKNHDRAIEMLRKIIVSESKECLETPLWQIYYYLASCYNAKKDYDTALQAIDLSVRQTPSSLFAIYLRTFICYNMGNYGEAFNCVKTLSTSKFRASEEIYNSYDALVRKIIAQITSCELRKRTQEGREEQEKEPRNAKNRRNSF